MELDDEEAPIESREADGVPGTADPLSWLLLRVLDRVVSKSYMQSAPCLRHASQMASLEHLIFRARQKAHERLSRCFDVDIV